VNEKDITLLTNVSVSDSQSLQINITYFVATCKICWNITKWTNN